MKLKYNKHNKAAARLAAEDTIEILNAKSPFAYTESYKSLRTNLNFVSLNNEYKKIVVTSSIPNEGKSSVSINLAIALAENGSRVLLVDADLRKSVLHRRLKLNRYAYTGLSSVLSGTAKLSDCINYHSGLGIDILLAGTVPPNPAEMLGSSRMQELIKVLDASYDYVIYDTPPVSLVTDAAVLSQHCDGVLLVIRQNFATFEQVKLAKSMLESVNANILGAVLNQYDVQKNTRAYSSKQYAYYSYTSYESAKDAGR